MLRRKLQRNDDGISSAMGKPSGLPKPPVEQIKKKALKKPPNTVRQKKTRVPKTLGDKSVEDNEGKVELPAVEITKPTHDDMSSIDNGKSVSLPKPSEKLIKKKVVKKSSDVSRQKKVRVSEAQEDKPDGISSVTENKSSSLPNIPVDEIKKEDASDVSEKESKPVAVKSKKKVLKKRSLRTRGKKLEEMAAREAKRDAHINMMPAKECLEIADEADRLEAAVLGAEDDVIEALAAKQPAETADSDMEVSPVVSRPKRKPAWEDEDDADDTSNVNVVKDSRYRALARIGESSISRQEHQKRLKKRFEVVTGSQPAWADLDLKDAKTGGPSDAEEEEKELLQRTGDYLSKSSQVLAPTFLDYKPVTHANKAQLHKASVSSVRFHPSSQVIMTAGKDETLAFFQVDGVKNAKIHSVFIESFPIYNARFTTDGCHVLLTSKIKSFYDYDMMSGRLMNVQPIRCLDGQSMRYFELSPCGKYIAFRGDYGYIHILSTKSKELVCQLKMNGSVNAFSFSYDGRYLYSIGDDGEVYVWEMSSRDCIHRFRDEGCLNGTSICTDPMNNFLVCGSESGVVNIYRSADCLQTSDPKPVKVVNNLLTQCTSSRFNSTSELLALASLKAEKSVKLVNTSSLNIYQNFPSLAEKMSCPSDVDFSPNGGYMATGCTNGIVHLYRLMHYRSY